MEGGKYRELKSKRDIVVEEIAAIERDAKDKFVWGRIVISSATEVRKVERM